MRGVGTFIVFVFSVLWSTFSDWMISIIMDDNNTIKLTYYIIDGQLHDGKKELDPTLCPFPIGWLINRGFFSQTTLTTGK